MRTTSIVFPILVTTVGVGWLLTVLNVDPRIHWIPVLGMAAIGVLTLVMGGVDKVTIVVGPFLLTATCFAVAREVGLLTFEVMLPSLVIVAGGLLFAAHILPVPYPRWLTPPAQLTGNAEAAHARKLVYHPSTSASPEKGDHPTTEKI